MMQILTTRWFGIQRWDPLFLCSMFFFLNVSITSIHSSCSFGIWRPPPPCERDNYLVESPRISRHWSQQFTMKFAYTLWESNIAEWKLIFVPCKWDILHGGCSIAMSDYERVTTSEHTCLCYILLLPMSIYRGPGKDDGRSLSSM